ncbi:LOW QUALITY PROTEIN: taste receptor type 2 member 7-like [Phascolarctos cinereus]|uniref:Taste receptor type 2 n=1 Tax=Phascolarctos cinereus TaxID=38626 RepID=A0A6P5J2M1_PHACI|nr:LOW QUALITY PROTEIN: taste receptor type 2 member 7-like [Phascolarctos cinereus]
MPSVLESIYVIVASGECLVGVLANGFIGLVNCIDCVKTRRVTSLDFILTGLAISRIGTLLSLITSNIFLFGLKSNSIRHLVYLEVIWNLSSHSSAWFGSCLSVFYFLKIATFSHPAFLWLKWRINKVVLRMLMGCWLISLLIILTMAARIAKIKIVSIDQGNETVTHNNQEFKTLKFPTLIISSTGGSVPFALSLCSCFLLILSLWRHTQQMRLRVMGSRDPSTEAHVRAMKAIVSFLFLFVLYHLGIIMAVFNLSMLHSKLVAMFSLMIMNVYPMTHSIILILGHSKLREASVRVLGKHRLPQSPWESLSGRD